MGMTHSCILTERHPKRRFNGSVLLEQEISQLSLVKSGFKLMPCITRGGLQPIRIAFR